MAFDVQYDFRLTFCCREKLVCLKTFDRRESVKGIRLCHRDHIVRNRINAELPLVEILHDIFIAELGEIGEAIDIVCEVGRICQTDAVSSGRHILSRDRRVIQVRILVLEVIGFEPRLAVIEVIDGRIEAQGQAAPAPVIEPKPPSDVVCDRECHLSQERWSPRTQICRRNRKAKRLVERLVKIGPPKNGHVPHVRGHILENHAIIFVNANRSSVKVKVGLR